MAIRYLLDTNIASSIIKGNKPAVDRHLAKVEMAELAISAVTEGNCALERRGCPMPRACTHSSRISFCA